MGITCYMVIFLSTLLCIVVTGKVSKGFVMVPMNTGDNINDNGNENLARMIETGQIPDELMNQILQAAESYMEMFNRNPSKFLKRSSPQMEKKMASGIVSLTRPRFGKRSQNSALHLPQPQVRMYGGPLDGAEYDENIAAELMSPLTKAIYVYLVKNYGLPINSKSPRSSNDSKLFTNLTRPRFGKRSLYGPGAVMKIIQGYHDGNLAADDDDREKNVFYIGEES